MKVVLPDDAPECCRSRLSSQQGNAEGWSGVSLPRDGATFRARPPLSEGLVWIYSPLDYRATTYRSDEAGRRLPASGRDGDETQYVSIDAIDDYVESFAQLSCTARDRDESWALSESSR